MKSNSVAGSPLERETRPSVSLASAVDAALRGQVVALAADLERRARAAHADQLPDADAPGDLIKERLDRKRRELQEHLDIVDELKQRLKVLRAIAAPAPHELRVRVLLMQGSIYDFTRLGRAKQRERLDRALGQAAQILETRWNTAVVFGQPEVIEKDSSTWELTPDALWRLGDLYASEGTPALLFADRILLPDKTLPHSWGRSDRSIACIGESEWLSEGSGLITAHNLAHLLGVDDNQNAGHLMSHDEIGAQLSQSEIEQLQGRAAERAACWVEENAAAQQRGAEALDLTQPAVILLEEQGDQLWQLYQTCLERGKDTPAYGVTATLRGASLPPAWSDLAYQVERLSQQVTRAEQELAEAKRMLAVVLARLRELVSEGSDGSYSIRGQDGR
jgi:hypothetical protein